MDKEIKEILILCKEYIEIVHHDAECRYDDSDGDLYMDAAQYEIIQETDALMERINTVFSREPAIDKYFKCPRHGEYAGIKMCDDCVEV